MNRNNLLPHVALALVIILIAAFAGQVRNWRRDWHFHRHGGKHHAEVRMYSFPDHGRVALRSGTELFVRFRPEVRGHRRRPGSRCSDPARRVSPITRSGIRRRDL
jgi:hypothetical protein